MLTFSAVWGIIRGMKKADMSKKKGKRRHRPMSALDKISSRIKRQVGWQLILDQMSPAKRKAFEESWRNTPKWSEMTEEEQKACEKDQGLSREQRQELEREYRNDQDRRFLQIGMALKSDDPDSELFKTSKEAVDLYDRCKKDPLSVSQYHKQRFYAILDRYIILLKAEIRKRQKEKAGKGGGIRKRSKGVLNEQVGQLLKSSLENISARKIAETLNETYTGKFKPTTAGAVGKTENWKNRHTGKKNRKKKINS